MLYLVSPNSHQAQWTDIPGRSTIALAKEHGADLAKLEWQPAEERPFTPDLLRLALRHGHPCSTGIVIDAGLVSTLDHGDRIRDSHSDVQRAQAQLRENNQRMERMFPGWIAHGEELDARIAASSNEAAQRADQEAAELLAADTDPILVEHWQRLGGDVPA